MLETLLLIACICIVIAIILYLFYWNRFVALLISWVFRLAFWGQGSSRVWIDIGAIHVSLLAGRILLKEVSYHTSNLTVRIVRAQIEWRYWIRRPTLEEDIGVSLGIDDYELPRKSRSCRVQVTLHGLECFLYNRTPAYENIIDQLTGDGLNRPSSRGTDIRWSSRKGSVSIIGQKVPNVIRRAGAWARSQLPSLDPKDLLPLGIQATKAVIVCGNRSTPQLLLIEFKRAEGTFGVIQSRSKHDLYKQLLNLRVQNVVVRCKANEDYHESMTASGDKVQLRIQQYSRLEKASHYLRHLAFSKLWHQLKLFALTRPPASNKKNEMNNTSLHDDFPIPEYAEEPRILDAPMVDLSYYLDVVGEVPPLMAQSEPTGVESIDIGNGGLPPQWGIDIAVRNGVLRYGPWADRQRVDLQRAFFPQLFHDILPTPHLNPGDQRMWTNLRVFIELLDNTTLHVPFREPSKNWQWDDFSNPLLRPKKREPAWIHVAVGDRSSISYMLPMVAGPDGYDPFLEVHLDTIEITSSLNDIRLVSAETCRIRGELPSPLKWKAERKWVFGITLRQPILYLLRDHINMITDLVRDWTTGPPHDYHRFIPTIYRLELELHHYEVNLYINDLNIIDKPLIRDDNAFLILRGQRFKTEVEIPANVFRPDSTSIPFTCEFPDLYLYLSLPRWHTSALYSPKGGDNIGHIALLRIDASYRYFAEVRETNVERLKLNFLARQVAFKALGWSIRYFMVTRENYFGSFTHFSTLFEYLDKRKRGLPPGDPILAKYRPGQSNALEVDLTIKAVDSIMIAPASLPGYEISPAARTKAQVQEGVGPSVVLLVPELQLQLRVHDFYMDMSLNLDMISGFFMDDFPERVARRHLQRSEKESTIIIDGINIVANRLFGPQPRTATYVCIWEVQVGAVTGVLSASDGRILMAALNAFRLNYVDAPNSPAPEDLPPDVADMTFLKFALKSLEVTWRANAAAVVIKTPKGFMLASNDQPGQHYRKVVTLRLPEFAFKLLHGSSSKKKWAEAAALSGDLYLDLYFAPQGWQESANAQQAFIQEQDVLTGRAARMFSNSDTPRYRHRGGVYLPQPRLSNAAKVKSRPHAPARAAQTRMGSGRWSKLSDLSESDVEEGVSEAIRDARLAKSRTLTPLPLRPQLEDDQSMTGGDESDDEDLTAESSESDFMDDGIPPAGGVRRLYSRYVRHYISPCLDTPALWDHSAYILLREREKIKLTAPIAKHQDIPTMTMHQKIPDSSSFDSTIFRVQCRKAFEIVLTPLLTLVLGQLEENLEMKLLSPELHIDAILAKHMNTFPAASIANETIIDVDIQGARVIMLHHADVPGDQVPASESSLPVTAVLALDCNVDCCRFILDIKDTRPSLQLSVQQIYLQLVPTRAVGNIGPPSKVASILLSGLAASLAQEELDISWNDFSATLDPEGPDYVIALGLAGRQSISAVKEVRRRWISYSSTLTQNIIHDAIQASENLTIVDVLSTIQPSYFVQRGIAHELRDNTTLRFLFHLRSCLWMIEDRRGFRSLRKDTPSLNMRDTLKLLEERFSSLASDIEGSHVPHLRTLEATLFPSRKQNPSGTPNIAVNSLSIKWRSIQFIIPSPSGGPSSEASLLKTFVAARRRIYSLDKPPAGEAVSGNMQLPLSRHISFVASVEELRITVSPYLMVFTRHVLRLMRAHSDAGNYNRQMSPTAPKRVPSSSHSPFALHGEISISLQHLCVQAAAQNLTFEFITSYLQYSATLLAIDSKRSINNVVQFDKISLQARSPRNPAKRRDKDVLASISLASIRLIVIASQETEKNPHLRSTFSVSEIALSVPRSALRLYRFVEEWKADFLPGIETTLQALLLEMRRSTPQSTSSPVQSQQPVFPVYQVQGIIKTFAISLQVMHGTWVSWDFRDVVVSLQSSNSSALHASIALGLQLTSQFFSISSGGDQNEPELLTRVKFAIPQISLASRLEPSSIRVSILIDEFHSKVKASHLHTLLAVQQKFGQDFNELVALVHETQAKRSALPKPLPHDSRTLEYQLDLKVRGFRIGLKSLSSTLFLECKNIYGGMENAKGSIWHVGLSDLALSLAPRATTDLHHAAFNRNHRSAFVIIDLLVGTQRKESDSQDLADTGLVLKIEIPKIHAVMQPSSIGEVGDLLDHVQAELLALQEQRALELAAFKERTKQVLRTFEAPATDDAPRVETPPWFRKYTVDISMRNFGVAFPLTLEHGLELPQTGYRSSSTIRAFLFSIKSIHFGAQRGERGHAIMKDFTFQFVPRFRQSVASDFSGEMHFTRNRLVYPEMTAQMRSEASSTSRKIQVEAVVSGFILDIDSSIPEYVFSLIDVYRQGKDRISRLSTHPPRTPISPHYPDPDDSTALQKRYKAVPTSNILASLTFLSGKVRIYSGSAQNLGRSKSYAHEMPSKPDSGDDILELPIVSVWAEYRATPAAYKLVAGPEVEPSMLMFKSTIHSSENTLKPTLLPFVTELTHHVETRMRKISRQVTDLSDIIATPSSSNFFTPTERVAEPVSSMRISFSLRIDQSKLELTCQPDVNVIAGLHWHSGAFIFNISPGARNVTFSGSVTGLTVGLKHGFLSEDCLRLDARNLSFSVTFAKMQSSVGSVSLVVDTECSGAVHFSRLQDVLCFKAVWLDRIPILTGQSRNPDKQPIKQPVSAPATKEDFTTAILLRIRDIKLDVDLGHSISAVTLDLKDTLLRTKITESYHELAVSVAEVALEARGNVSGKANVPNCVFRTIRRREAQSTDHDGSKTMLELRMTSGSLAAMLESEHQRLVCYRAEPLEIEVWDDWSNVSPDNLSEGSPLRLSFMVTCSDIVAAVTVNTIPKLLFYANKFKANLQAQRDGASRESKTFRVTRTPKPDNPLSTVANAMLNSARSRFKEAEADLSYVISQYMSLTLGSLRLMVFPRTMHDIEVASFVARGVHARLDRLVEADSLPSMRDLRLAFSGMTISRLHQLKSGLAAEFAPLEAKEWITALLKDAAEATIVGLPSMHMHMKSEEEKTLAEGRSLEYDFDSRFVRREGMRDMEDIFITLNMALYSWLTVLRKALAREMEQVQATADWRGGSPLAPPVTGGRRKVPDALYLGDDLKATTSLRSSKLVAPAGVINSKTLEQAATAPTSMAPAPPLSATASGASDMSQIAFPQDRDAGSSVTDAGPPNTQKSGSITYQARERHIERLTMRQLGEATPDVRHPFFAKKAGFNLEDSLPQYVHEYATVPLEEIMEVLLKLYSRQLLAGKKGDRDVDSGRV